MYVTTGCWIPVSFCHCFNAQIASDVASGLLEIGFCVLSICLCHPLSSSFLSCSPRCCRSLVYLPCLSPGMSHFSWVLSVENGVEKPRSAHWMCSLLLKCFRFEALPVLRPRKEATCVCARVNTAGFISVLCVCPTK